MKKIITTCITSVLIMGSSIASAEDELEFSANVAYTSNYLFYGASQTDTGPAVSGGFDLTLPWSILGGDIYVGTWASSVEQGVAAGGDKAASLELDVYGGIAGELSNGISWDLGAWQYMYPDQGADTTNVSDFNYVEYYANFGYTFSDVKFTPSLSVGVYYSPDYFGSNNRSIYVPFGVDIALPYDFGLYASGGYFDLDQAGTSDYVHYGFGITKTVFGLDLDASWNGNESDCGAVQGVNCGGAVFSISKAF